MNCDVSLIELVGEEHACLLNKPTEFVEGHERLVAWLRVGWSVGVVELLEERLVGLKEVVARLIPVPLLAPFLLTVEVWVA